MIAALFELQLHVQQLVDVIRLRLVHERAQVGRILARRRSRTKPTMWLLPGDVVILQCDKPVTIEEAARIRARWEERTGLEAVVLSGVRIAAVSVEGTEIGDDTRDLDSDAHRALDRAGVADGSLSARAHTAAARIIELLETEHELLDHRATT